MAQLVVRKYIGAMEAKANTPYAGSLFPTNTIMQIKSDIKDLMASVNGSPMFPVHFNDESLIDSTYTYKFNKDCVIALQVLV